MLILSIKLVTPIFSSTLFNPPVTPLTTLPNFSPILLPSDLIPSTANDAMFLIAFPIRPGSFFAPSTMLSNVSAAYDFTSSNKSEVPSYNFCTPSIAPSFIHKNALTVSSFMPVTFPSTHVANLPNLPVTQLNISIIFWLDSSRIDENLLTTPFFKFVAVVVTLVFISPNQPVTELYIFVTRLIALFFNVVKLPVTEFLISVALFVILVHKLENHVVMELYIFVTRLIALSFNVVKLPVTESLISVALEVTLLHKFWNHPVTLPYMPAIRLTTLSFSSVKRCTTVSLRFIALFVIFVHKFWNQVTTELYMPVILFIAPSLSSVNLVTTLSLILVTFSTIVVHKLENHIVIDVYISEILDTAPFFNSVNLRTTSSFICSAFSVRFVHRSENHCFAPSNNSPNKRSALSFKFPKNSVTRSLIDNAVSFNISPNRSHSPSIIAATPEIIPCIKSIATPITSLIFSQTVSAMNCIVGQRTPHMPSTIGAKRSNKSLTNVSAKSTAILIPSNTFSTTVCIALKINAPSESHQLFISLNAPMKNSLTAPISIPILSFTSSKAICILATAKNILSIVSSLKPIDDNISAAPMWSPLNIAMTPSNAVTTLSLNSI